MSDQLIADSLTLWRHLVDCGDLQPEGHDAGLLDELASLGSLGLPPDAPLPEALADVPVERLLLAFFGLAQPYADMWQDLLVLFERAAASVGSQQLDLVWNFSAENSLAFDLDQFRRQIEVFRELMSPFDLRTDDSSSFWSVRQAFGLWNVGRDPVRRPDLQELSAELRDGPFPEGLPPRPTVDDPVLDPLLEETWLLAGTILGDLRAVLGSHDGVLPADPPRAPSGLSPVLLRDLESDYWLSSLVEVLSRLPDDGLGEIASRLDPALAPLRNGDPAWRSPQKRLEDLLSLPLWQHRYDLYSNWVTTRIVAALDDQEPVVHSTGGRLEFLFSGTHLATFEHLRPHVHIWCEYRTALADPVGDRKGNIQPDITLRRDPLTASSNPLVVECKQYAKPANQAFADALTDYARGHPAARVVLVNYGRGREPTVLAKVAAEVRDRTAFVPFLRPGQPEALDRFADVVRTALDVGAFPARTAADAPAVKDAPAVRAHDDALTIQRSLPVPLVPGAAITLSWSAAPRDLDLHLVIGEPPGWEVSFRERGRLDAEPYAWLLDDVTQRGGSEVVQVSRWLPVSYRVEVVNYSGEAPISAAAPVVELLIGADVARFTCPSTVGHDRWLVCALNGLTGELRA